MKNSEIHNGLPQKEIRDFLAISMVKVFEAECDNKKKYPHHKEGDDVLERAKNMAKAEIKYLERYIINISNKQGIYGLIESNGWIEYDVSDDTQNDTGHKLSMSFIGTKEEYEKFFHELYPQEK